ncbi:hypothetical protein PVK06_014611 [Gossypium arboreum]|uniref:Uncharacterized protein n=1 Tax=Gossypium arboreum TaxID=29729 RepID=A0ABR0PUZ3_GOSAR|nr:hypothetical protein PVK06_014611 [Gossypium arboreum]
MEDFEKITVQGSQIRQRTNIPGDGFHESPSLRDGNGGQRGPSGNHHPWPPYHHSRHH